jgi:hypothetical protein
MIKLKDILLENDAPNIFIPRRIEGRVERMIKIYIRNGNKGSLNLQELDLTVLPVILKDITVDGSFWCSKNHLTSLINSPKYVSTHFYCNDNRLTSLEGAPGRVGDTFWCGGNNLTTLKGAPSRVGGNFDCHNNKLTSFVGSPGWVAGDLKCNDNKLKSLDGVPKFVGGSFRCENNPGNFTEKDIRAVCDVLGSIFL